MGLNLMAIRAVLGLDSSDYEKGLDKAKGGLTDFGKSLDGMVSTAKKAIAAIGIGAAVKKGVNALKQGISEVAAFGDNIDKASQKMGISAKAYQEWEAVLQHSGTSIDALNIGMKTLANAAAEGNDAFKKLGISQKDAANMSREELFNKTITALQNVKDANKRAQLAQELFGRSAMELGPLLNTSAKETQAMKDRVEELGGVLSDQAVKDSAAFQDSIQDMNTAIDGMKRRFMASFLPSAKLITDGITNIVAGLKGGEKKLKKGIKDFIDNLGKQLPEYLKKGMRIAEAVGGAVLEAAPEIAAKIIAALPKIWNGVKDFIRNKGIPAVTKLLGSLMGGSSSVMGGMNTMLRKIAKNAADILEEIGDKVGEFWNVVVQPILHDIMRFVKTKLLPAILNTSNRIKPIIEELSPLISQAFQFIAGLWHNTLYPALNDMFDFVVNKLVPTIIDFVLNVAVPNIKAGFEFIKNIWENILQPTLMAIWDYVVNTVAPAVIKAWRDDIQPVVEKVFTAIAGFWNDILYPAMKSLYDYIVTDLIPTLIVWWEYKLRPAVEKVFSAIAGFWNDTLYPVLKKLYDYVVTDLIPTLIVWWEYKLQPAVEKVFSAIARFWSDILYPVLKKLYDYVVTDLIPTLIVWWEYKLQPAVKAVFEAIGTFWEKYGKPALDAFRTFVRDNVIPTAEALGEKFQYVWDTCLKPLGAWLQDSFLQYWQAVKDQLADMLTFLTGAFSGDWEKAWDALVRMVQRPFDLLASLLKSPINAVIRLVNSMIFAVRDAINTVIDKINTTFTIDWTWDLPDWLGGSKEMFKFSPNLSRVNWQGVKELAGGGILSNGGRAIVGEYVPEWLEVLNGRAVVTPMGGQTRRAREIERETAPRNERPIQIVFELEGAQKWIYRLNKAEEQRVGLKLSTGGAT